MGAALRRKCSIKLLECRRVSLAPFSGPREDGAQSITLERISINRLPDIARLKSGLTWKLLCGPALFNFIQPSQGHC